MLKSNKVMAVSMIFSFLLHIVMYIYLPNFIKNENEEKKNEQEIKVKLIEYKKPQMKTKKVSSIKKSTKDTKVVKKKTGKNPVHKEKQKIVPKGQKIVYNEKLPEIDIPKLETVEYQDKIAFDKPDKKNLTIKRQDVKNNFQGENIDLIESEEKFDLSETEFFAPEIKEEKFEIDTVEVKIKDGVLEEGKSIGEIQMPDAVQLELVEGKGEVMWEPSNKLPNYPSEAEKRGWQGKVILVMSVDENGTVKSTIIEKKSGHDVLDMAAQRAAKFWRIHVINNNGVKIEGKVRLGLSFDLKR